MGQQEQPNKDQSQKGSQGTSQAGFSGMKSEDQKKFAADGADASFNEKDLDSDVEAGEGSKSNQAGEAAEKNRGSGAMDRNSQSRTNQ